MIMFARRIRFIGGLLLPAVLLLVGGLAKAAEHESPNVVLIISDDQTWTDFGFMGHEHIDTPHIDRLASQSLTFTRGYVPHALCRASLMTMVTGLQPHQHRVVGNDPKPETPENRRKLISHIDDLPTLPRMLNREKGYLSHQSGKWWEGHYSRGGFTHGMTKGFGNHPRGRHGDEGLKIGRQGMDPIFDFIDTAQQKDKPFFVWYAPFLPHRPHNPPKRLLDKYRQTTDSIHVARYRAMCEWFDETVGQLLGHLDKQGLRKNTIVLFVVDNGWIQQRDSGGYAPRSKRTAYEGGVRTPIMVRWPGHVEPRMDRTTPVSSVDLAPTILRACGLEPTNRMRGVNLLNREAVEQRDAVFGATYYHDVRSLKHPAKSLKRRWGIDGWWKLLLPHEPNLSNAPVELYNLKQDPHEKQNLAEQHPERVERLKKQINGWWPAKRPGDGS